MGVGETSFNSRFTHLAGARPMFLPRIDSLLLPMCDTAQLVPIRFWRMGHGRVVKTLAITVGARGVSKFLGSPIQHWYPPHETIRSRVYPAASARRHILMFPSYKRIHITHNGRIRLSVSTVNRTYELSGITHVTPFRKYGKHSTGPSTYGPWVRTYSKLFSCKPVLTVCSYRAQSNEICTYGRVSRGSLPRVRRYGLLYLRTVENDHCCVGENVRNDEPLMRNDMDKRDLARFDLNLIHIKIPWWRHQMETFSALLSLCEGNPTVTGGFLSQRPVTQSFLLMNKRLSKQSRRRWFETPPWSLWRHCNTLTRCLEVWLTNRKTNSWKHEMAIGDCLLSKIYILTTVHLTVLETVLQIEIFSALLAICAGNSPATGEFPAQRPVARSFGVFFDLRLNKRLSKQSWGWWFETQKRPLWRHCNGAQAGSWNISKLSWVIVVFVMLHP